MATTETNEKLKELLVKKPFTRILPDGAYEHGNIQGDVRLVPVHRDTVLRKVVTQEDFLRELDPLGHAIHNRD